MTVAVVAEKPAVARDIAKVLGAGTRGNGYLHGNGYVVTWAIGHLVTLAQPHQIRPEWKRWRRDLLPMLPTAWPLVVDEARADQFTVVEKILCSDTIRRVVCATDAGREGELIFRYIYEAASCSKPVSRLWISSLTPEAIRDGFRKLRDGRHFDPLAAAARARSQADWLVGMNLSRACTLAFGGDSDTLSVGRVQTPTLAMVVERELAIRAFKPEDYREVVATFSPERPSGSTTYRGTYFRGAKPSAPARRLPATGEEAAAIVERALGGNAAIASVRTQKKRMAPPLLYDLTELQRHANRLYGFSAAKTLALAQALYEVHKLISYPRTDSRHLSEDLADNLGNVVAAIRSPYEDHLAPGTGDDRLGRRFVDDARVTDHHAIIPTPKTPGPTLRPDEQKIYDLICRRLLAAWHQDHVWSVTTVVTAITSPPEQAAGEPVVDRYHSSGTMVLEMGWKVLDIGGDKKRRRKKKAKDEDPDQSDQDQDLPANLTKGEPTQVLDARSLAKQTRPPKRLTEATLLTAMETAGKTLDDKELSQAMKENGLGTPATRAEIIETLLRRTYIERKGKILSATDRGIGLIDRVHPQVKSPVMTGRWEAALKQIEAGQGELATFMAGIEKYVQEVVGEVFSASHPPRQIVTAPVPSQSEQPAQSEQPSQAGRAPTGSQRTPTSADQLGDLLSTSFGHSSFRPFQETVCQAVTTGRNVLLVMPTGAGKSLCYQLPGLARAGTTLVVSPLIALMEDQVAKLQELGLRAERIHSGRSRINSRQTCYDYLGGHLDFLFIAPERLSVPGFPEMLAKRKPVLIAIDEAHCISHWGHDFRPDYRMLGKHLPGLGPTPVIALTATATPVVQRDIVEQLGLDDSRRFIHGFRRTNIAVEVAAMPPSARRQAVCDVLADARQRPAIVYAPTRKEADGLSRELVTGVTCAAYHAGMIGTARDTVQAAFLAGELEVIVATTAFGMGVDKPDVRTVIHTGLPGTLEGYYQEIGRAGRDGKPARAILLYSWADRRTHEYFHGRDYPEDSVLAAIFARLSEKPQPAQVVRKALGIDEEIFEKALEKLWIHGGAAVDPDETISAGLSNWRQPYLAQRDHRLAQLGEMTRFADSHGCRMLHLVNHFGDREDSGQPCGLCDSCARDGCLVRIFRQPTGSEQETIRRIINSLRQHNGRSTGQIFRETCAEGGLDRRGFEQILGGLALSGVLLVSADSFEKDGRLIHFKRATLTAQGRHCRADDPRIRLAEEHAAPGPKARAKKPRAGKTRAPKARASKSGAAKPAKKPARTAKAAATPARFLRGATPAAKTKPGLSAQDQALYEQLRQWRRTQASKQRTPAFRIMSDRTLTALAVTKPVDAVELLAIPGIGPARARKHGDAILRIVSEGAWL